MLFWMNSLGLESFARCNDSLPHSGENRGHPIVCWNRDRDLDNGVGLGYRSAGDSLEYCHWILGNLDMLNSGRLGLGARRWSHKLGDSVIDKACDGVGAGS